MRKLWTKDELILAFNLYLKIPFGKINSRNPDIIHLSKITGRSVNSIALRLANFAHIDPIEKARGIKGMSGGKKQVQPIWDEFYRNKEDLIFESERILAEKENLSIEVKYKYLLQNISDLKGSIKLREIKTRVNQNVFRQIVLANYSGKCAITNIDIPELLIASHIIPWSKNVNERLNPENGICLSPLYDKAFDKGLISINERYQILISDFLKGKKDEEFYSKNFAELENKEINLPSKYLPKREFLQFHLDTIFNKNFN